MAGTDVTPPGSRLLALRTNFFRTPGMKKATSRQLQRAGYRSLQDKTFFHPNLFKLGDGRKQCPRIGVHGRFLQFLGLGNFDESAQVHHGNAVRDVINHPQIVSNEKIGEAEVFLLDPPRAG